MFLRKIQVRADSSLGWDCAETPVPGQPGARRIAWRIVNTGSSLFHGVIQLAEEFPAGMRRPWILLPGMLYGENRRVGPGIREDSYPRFDPAADHPARMTSNTWDFAADRLSHTLVFAFEQGQCFALIARPHVTLGDDSVSDDWEPQVSMGFSCNGQGGEARITFPACELPFTYADSTQSRPTIRRVVIPPGAAVSGEAWRMDFTGIRHDYQRVLEFFYRAVGEAEQAAEAADPEGLMRDAVHGLVDWHYNEPRNYFVYTRCFDRVSEQIANHKGVSLEWHQMNTGFVSGFQTCWALSVAANSLRDERAREVSHRVADRICMEGISPSGLFWADFRPGIVEERNGTFPNPISPDGQDHWGSGWWKEQGCIHARTIADANYGLANLILSERQGWCRAGSPLPAVPVAADKGLAALPSLALWERTLRGNLEAILRLQLPNGSYGAVYDAVEGRMRREQGCGGLLWIPAIVAACEVFEADPAFVRRLEASIRRAADAYAADVEAEYIWGAPEDNDSPTSEDGLNAVLAYGDLYRRFHDPRHLRLMRLAADWTLSFRKAFNGRFHPKTLIGAYDLRSKGGDYASVSNNHLHIFEVLMTSHLRDLSRWTGCDYYRQRAEDHWRYAQQLLVRVDGQFNGFRGALAEQFYWCNWSSFGQDTQALEPDGFKGNWDPGPHHRQKGNLCGFSTLWCISVILLGAAHAIEHQKEAGECREESS